MSDRITMLKVAEDVSDLTGHSIEEVMFAFLSMTTIDDIEYIHMFVNLVDKMDNNE